MARIRQIKPEFFLDDELATIPRDARLLFIGLWVIADREGRLDDRPLKIKAQVFPYDHDLTYQKIDALLNNLWQMKYIIRYHANGRKLIQIRSFSKHQHCHLREAHSTIPAPDKTDADNYSTVQAPDLHLPSTDLAPAEPVASTSTSTSTSTSASTKSIAAQKTSPPVDADTGSVHSAKERPKDEAYELFTSAFQEHRKTPYRARNGNHGDFVQLSNLRKQLAINTRDVPENWEKAINNYLSSPLTTYTLADLCVRYDVFVLGEVDRFGRPAGYNDIRQSGRATIGKMSEKGFFDA